MARAEYHEGMPAAPDCSTTPRARHAPRGDRGGSREVVFSSGARLREPSRFFRCWFADVFSCRTTAWRLFLRHLAQQYRLSSLGILWAFAPAALTAMVLIGGPRSHVIGPSGDVPAAFYGVFGVALAQSFLESVNATRRVFTNHHQLLRRQNVPLDGLIVASLVDVAFNMLVRLSIVAAVFFLFSIVPLPATLPLALVGYFGVAILGAGVGLLVAPINALKRDMEHAFALLPWALFAITPVFVPAAAGTLFGRIAAANPLAWYFDGIRAAAYGGLGFPAAAIGGTAAGIVILVCGWLFCRIAQPHVVERMLA